MAIVTSALRRQGRHRLHVLLVALLAAACGGQADEPAPPAVGAPPAGRDPGQRYEVTATVLERPGHRPQLCAGAIAESYPPQCGGPPVEAFDWDDVEGEVSAGGVTWAEVHLVGTFDGRTFHLVQAPSPPRPQPSPGEPELVPPCPEPAGGWAVVDASRTGDDDWAALIDHVAEQGDLAGIWLSWPHRPPGERREHGEAVATLAFTGDLDRHRAEARARWGGPLCVIELPRTRAELQQAQEELFSAVDEAADAGVHLLSGGVDEPANVVRAVVLIADEEAQRWVDERVGEGLVVLEGRLRPVD